MIAEKINTFLDLVENELQKRENQTIAGEFLFTAIRGLIMLL